MALRSLADEEISPDDAHMVIEHMRRVLIDDVLDAFGEEEARHCYSWVCKLDEPQIPPSEIDPSPCYDAGTLAEDSTRFRRLVQ